MRPTERRVTARGRLPRRRRPHRDNLATRNAPVDVAGVEARPGRQIPNRHPLGESRASFAAANETDDAATRCAREGAETTARGAWAASLQTF